MKGCVGEVVVAVKKQAAKAEGLGLPMGFLDEPSTAPPALAPAPSVRREAISPEVTAAASASRGPEAIVLPVRCQAAYRLSFDEFEAGGKLEVTWGLAAAGSGDLVVSGRSVGDGRVRPYLLMLVEMLSGLACGESCEPLVIASSSSKLVGFIRVSLRDMGRMIAMADAHPTEKFYQENSSRGDLRDLVLRVSVELERRKVLVVWEAS